MRACTHGWRYLSESNLSKIRPRLFAPVLDSSVAHSDGTEATRVARQIRSLRKTIVSLDAASKHIQP